MLNLAAEIEDEVCKVAPMVRSRVPNRDVEDVLQDMRIAFLTAIPRFEGRSRKSTYLYRVAMNTICQYFRSEYKYLESKKKCIEGIKEQGQQSKIEGIKEQGQQSKIVMMNSPLTRRQSEVFGLVGNGWGNEKIASTLEISQNTLRVHIKKIYKKLPCQNRAELALLSYQVIHKDGRNEKN